MRIGIPDWRPVYRSENGEWLAMASDDVILGRFKTRAEAQAEVDFYRSDEEGWIRARIGPPAKRSR